MEEGCWSLPAQQAGDANLPAGRRQQVLAAYHDVDPLAEIIDTHRELVGPVAETIADQHVSALLRRVLLLPTQALIDERLDAGVHAHAPPGVVSQRQAAVAAVAVVTQFHVRGRTREVRRPKSKVRGPALDLLARAVARINEPLPREIRNRVAVDRIAFARTDEREVGAIPQPVEILEDARVVLRTAALAIVILDTQQHLRA